jgi:hypothetical protein
LEGKKVERTGKRKMGFFRSGNAGTVNFFRRKAANCFFGSKPATVTPYS